MPFSQKFYKTVAIVSLIGLSVLSYTTYDLYRTQGTEQHRQDVRDRNNQRTNCQTVGNPVLRAEIHSNKQEIVRTRAALQRTKGLDFDAIAKKLGVPKSQLLEGQRDQRANILQDQRILDPLLAAPSCAERYPPLDG